MPYRAQTELEAANLALSLIGEPPIGSFLDPTARARAVNLWFGTVRDEKQREHDWNFCSAWFLPTMDPKSARGPLINRFVLPEDCLKVRDVLPQLPNSNVQAGNVILITDPNIIAELEQATTQPVFDREWSIEAAAVDQYDVPPSPMVLVTNMTAPVVNYSRRITIVRLWDPIFVEGFAKELAAKIAPRIARDLAAAQRLEAQADEEIEEATRVDSREQSPRQISRETSWVRSRYIGSVFSRRRGWP